jgi:uncharacterized protein YjbI with pentapeptide repeats
MDVINNENFKEFRDQREFIGYTFEGLDIDYWERNRGSFENCTFKNCRFGGEVSLIDCRFRNVFFNNCKFNGVSMEDSVFTLCKFNDCLIAYNNSFSGCIFYDVMFNDCELVKNNFSNVSFNSTKFNRGKFYYNDMKGIINKGLGHYLEGTDVKL